MSYQEAAMRTLHFRSVERRRTVRVTLCVELIIQGSTENNGTFKVKGRTLSVSRHGGMMVMDPEVAMGQKLVLINVKSGQKAECQVVDTTKTARDGKRHIGFEFMSAELNLWKMCFPAAGAKPLLRGARPHFDPVLVPKLARTERKPDLRIMDLRRLVPSRP